ncbi:phenazine biosynthesis protein PhzF family [Amycolatopsis marina]|uniref:Phenazine biosynthesis protein PhzF family n=1 Tax=Amycolatopsis marina TaxID=490629 RepID=A0A1I1CPF2_9PSEU|nr:PhzF family phenazine biosynthesis protein [Amycolatopsis marina]SFB62313.1 phenazine biosynthesis protein PhzF family [Amycolatopsis marina]
MRLYLVDAFTSSAFAGNSAGVVLLDEPADPEWMQAVAAELKHSETAFVQVGTADGVPKPLRWFTPAAEVDLCGHATLATAHVLGGDQVFTTRSGLLRCTAAEDGVRMDFPADPPKADPALLAEVTPALPGVSPGEIEYVGRGVSDVLVRLTNATLVRELDPDIGAVARIAARCLIVTASGDREDVDFVSRVFGPRVGIDEDPVTGSAHCTLAPFWAEQIAKAELVGEQASQRGGIVRARPDDDRVWLTGAAVTVFEGTLLV